MRAGPTNEGDRLPPTLILAAGKGTRVGQLGRQRAKVLVPIGGRPLLALQLEDLALLGTAGAAVNALAALGDRAFLVLYGDVLTFQPITPLLPTHCEVGAMATLCVYEHDDPREKGIVEVDHRDRVTSFAEKDPGPNWAATRQRRSVRDRAGPPGGISTGDVARLRARCLSRRPSPPGSSHTPTSSRHRDAGGPCPGIDSMSRPARRSQRVGDADSNL